MEHEMLEGLSPVLLHNRVKNVVLRSVLLGITFNLAHQNVVEGKNLLLLNAETAISL